MYGSRKRFSTRSSTHQDLDICTLLTVLDYCTVKVCNSRTITRVCRSSMAAETRGLGLQVDTMQFYADLSSEILERKCTIFQEFTLETKHDRVAQDDRDGRPGCQW